MGYNRVVNNRVYSNVPAPSYRRSLFHRESGNLTTFDEGVLVPLHVEEIIGGDTMFAQCSCVFRQTTPLTPTFDAVFYDMFAFFVPTRLVFKEFEQVLSGQDPDKAGIAPVDVNVPRICASAGDTQSPVTLPSGSLYDYLYMPTKVAIPYADSPTCLVPRMYRFIYNEYFRDENLQDKLPFNTSIEDDPVDSHTLLKVNKKHDYFTSCLPFAQKGPATTISLGGLAPLVGNDFSQQSTYYDGYSGVGGLFPSFFEKSEVLSTNSPYNITGTGVRFVGDSLPRAQQPSSGQRSLDVSLSHFHNIPTHADLSQSIPISINDFRSAVVCQHIAERNARLGTRYVEILRGIFGTAPDDATLQRPQLVGVSRGTNNMSTVVQTSSSTDESPLGELGGKSEVRQIMKFSFNAKEPGYLLILGVARCQLTYQYGMPKMYQRYTRTDQVDPLKCNLGEQPVKRKEIVCTSDSEYNNETFGFQPIFDDMRQGCRRLTAYMRSNTGSKSFDFWHYADSYNVPETGKIDDSTRKTLPSLSATWMEHKSPLKRTLAVTDAPDFYGDFFFSCNHARILPVHSVPGLNKL